MYEGTVQLVQQACTTCGYGPVAPQTSQYYDRVNESTVVEATWVCSRCGSRFAAGIVERIKDEQ